MSSLNGVPQINRPSLSGLTSINADQFTLGNVTITANSISGIDNINFNSFSVSTSAIFNCPVGIYGNLIVSQNIINPALSNANTEIFNQLSTLSNANVASNVRITALENANLNAYNITTGLTTGNTSAHTQILSLQNANVNLQLGNASGHTQILALQNANVNLQLGNASGHTRITALENANLNIQAGNASGHTRITTLESQTQLLSSNALVSVFSGNVALRSNVSLEKNIWNSCNIYSTSTPILNFLGDSIDGYYGTLQFCSGDGASRATISTSLLSGNLSMSYGLTLSGYRVRQSGTDLLTVNTANTWVRGNLNVGANLIALGNQHNLSGNLTLQGNLIVANINCTSTQSFFSGNVGIGTTDARAKLHVIGHSRILNNNNNTGFYVTETGNVGIGTSTPVGNLHVLGNHIVTGNIGIGTDTPSANVHIENQKIFKDANKNVLINPSQAHILCYNSINNNNEAHASICLRTNGAGGGNPHLSFDINGVFGWSIFQDNSDSDCLKIKAGWDMPSSSTFDCLRIGTDRSFTVYGNPIIRCRFHAIGSYAGSYTAGQNINFSYTVQDISGTSSNSAGVLTLPSYSGYYTVSCNGRFTDGNSTNGLYLYSGANNLFGSSDGVFWCPQDPSQRRCFSYTITRFLGGGNQIRAQMYGGTTFDLVLISVVYHGIQN